MDHIAYLYVTFGSHLLLFVFTSLSYPVGDRLQSKQSAGIYDLGNNKRKDKRENNSEQAKKKKFKK